MNIQQARLFIVIITLSIIITKQYQIFYYLPVMMISIEYLNSNKSYIQSFNYRLINSIFISFVLFITIDRGRPFIFNNTLEIILNSIEHALFGNIICLKASIYYAIIRKKQLLNITELSKIAICFNIFGFFNEFFQNWYKHQSIWQLTFDSRKDILMNIIGSILFVVFYQKLNNRLQIQNSMCN